jgi:hypothetical protein
MQAAKIFILTFFAENIRIHRKYPQNYRNNNYPFTVNVKLFRKNLISFNGSGRFIIFGLGPERSLKKLKNADNRESRVSFYCCAGI